MKAPARTGSTVPPNKAAVVRAQTVRRYALLAAGFALISILLGAGLLRVFVLVPYGERSMTQHRQARARAYVEVINSRVQMLQAEATRIATSANVITVAERRDPLAINALQATLLSNIGALRGLHIYPRGGATADPTARPPVNFSALDMVRTLENGTNVLPEVFRATTGLLVYAVAPVQRGTAPPVGTVLLIVDGSYLSDALGAIDPAGGKIRLAQMFAGSEPVPILEFGTGGAAESVRMATALPHWFLTYQPSHSTIEANNVTLLSLLPSLAIVALGVLGSIALVFMRLNRDLEADIQALRNALPLPPHRAPPQLRLSALDGLVTDLTAAFSRAEAPRIAFEEAAAVDPRRTRAVEPPQPPADINQEVEIPLEMDGDALEIATAGQDEPGPADTAGDTAERGIDPTIFRAYDIRGIVDRNLGEDVVYQIGRALGAEAAAVNSKRLVVGGDGRLSSPSLREAVIGGLRDSGIDVIDIGEVPTPLLYYATHLFRTGSGVMITGSHNPPDYNGMKIMLAGETLAEARIQRLRERIESGQLTSGQGSLEKVDVLRRYIDRITEDVTIAQTLKVVVDCGNGVAGKVAPLLLRALGCDVVELFCEVDGTFPNHHPDPAVPANLEDLIETVRREDAHIGLAFDGDGDRLGVVSNTGDIIWPDRLMMLFARDIVGRNPGTDVIYDVKCSRHLSTIITELGGRPIMWKTGHSHMKAKIKETGALLGGEFSGHICFLERWYGFDDALYSAARLLEIVGATTETVDEIFAQFPNPLSTPEIKIETTDEHKFEVVQRLAANGRFDGGSINTIDGIRVDFNDGWGLIRPSNTSPVLTLRFEADTAVALARITRLFQREIHAVDPTLEFKV